MYVFYFLNQTRNCIQTIEVKFFFRDIKCRRDDLPETTYLPLGANATTLTPYLCPGNSDICCFSCTSHIRTHGACPHSPVTKYLQKKHENFVKSICILRILYFEENFVKYIPAVLGKGQRGDGLAGSIDDMTLFIFAGVIEDHSAAGRVRHNTP